MGKDKLDVIKQSKYFLESFFSIQNWQLDYLLSAEDFLLDSGAYTFMKSKGKKIDYEEYARKYGEFIKRYEIKHFFELDIESVIGWDEYERLHDMICNITKREPIPVFHKSRGKEWYLDALKTHTYVACGGIASDGKKPKKEHLEIMKWLIKKAHEQKSQIHGLGFTSTTLFDQLHFDTVDSTTWTMGARMGNLCYLTKTGEMRQWYPKKNGKKPKNIKELTIHNYLEWCKFQALAERKF